MFKINLIFLIILQNFIIFLSFIIISQIIIRNFNNISYTFLILILLFDYNLFLYPQLILTETLAFFLITLTIYLITIYFKNQKIEIIILLSFIYSILLLTKTIMLYYSFLIFVFIFIKYYLSCNHIIKSFYHPILFLFLSFILLYLFSYFIIDIQHVLLDTNVSTVERRLKYIYCINSEDTCCTYNYTSCIINNYYNLPLFIFENLKNTILFILNGLLRIFFDPGDSSLYRYLFGNLGELSRSQLLKDKTVYEFLTTILSVNIISTIMFVAGIIYLLLIYVTSVIKIFNFKNNVLLLLFLILSIIYFSLVSADQYSNSRFRLIILPFMLVILSTKK